MVLVPYLVGGSIMNMGQNQGDVKETLKQRGSVYGSYEQVCKTRADILGILEQHSINVNGKGFTPEQQVAFGDLVLKLVRASGAPEYADSFHDLAGYATLMEEIVNEGSS